MLMLTLDDAVKVAEKIVEVYIDHSIEEGDTEYIKQELEQKCYIPEKGSAAERLSGLIMDINPAEVASMIQDDKLREWCKTIQVEMNMSLIKMDWGERPTNCPLEEVKHEECVYIITKGKAGYHEEYKCSACGDSFYWTQDRSIPNRFNYCKNCGAKVVRFVEDMSGKEKAG